MPKPKPKHTLWQLGIWDWGADRQSRQTDFLDWATIESPFLKEEGSTDWIMIGST